MTIENITNSYINQYPINYDINFVTEQLSMLKTRQSNECNRLLDDEMIISIILSALKFYILSSPEGFQDNIIDIIVNLEQIYGLDGLLEKILDIEED